MVSVPCRRAGRGPSRGENRAPPPATRFRKPTTIVRLSSSYYSLCDHCLRQRRGRRSGTWDARASGHPSRNARLQRRGRPRPHHRIVSSPRLHLFGAGWSRALCRQHRQTRRRHRLPARRPAALAGGCVDRLSGTGLARRQLRRVTASAAVVGGVGANALVGGFDRSFMLQPVSVEGQAGLDVAGGLAAVNLQYAP